MEITKTLIPELKEQLAKFSDYKQLSESDYDFINITIRALGEGLRKNTIDKEVIAEINRSFGEEFLHNTIQGYGLRKPMGYAGDYLIIDKIYTREQSEHPVYGSWDRFFHQQAAPKAVRNRKTYFKSQMVPLIEQSNETISLLNVASGPARDLLELYQLLPDPNKLKSTCVEIDERAVAYAKSLTEPYASNINFVNVNVFRYKPCGKYDVIWSAGLFDYFSDKAFIMVLQRMKLWLKPGGTIIIGNFNEKHNPSRDYMEIFGEWFLIHRTESQLKKLAILAGFRMSQITVSSEKERVNLFLHITGR